MKTDAPIYYSSFKCIADKCKHSCCVGWEIDIDDETQKKYEQVSGKIGERLSSCIQFDEDGAHFLHDKHGRCPFLLQNGLCEIICKLGEDMLCSICTDHPRFRNYYSDRVELGLGMCCEEAARIILSQKDDFQIVTISDDDTSECLTEEEKELFALRKKAIDIISLHDIPISQRLTILCKQFDVSFPQKSASEWVDIFLNLEQLDSSWRALISKIENEECDTHGFFESGVWEKAFENILYYYIYRHFSKGIHTNIGTVILFVVLAYHIIHQLCIAHLQKYGSITLDNLVEFCRMYSSEIEYSDENTDELLLELEFAKG